MELGNTSVRLVKPAAPSAPESPKSFILWAEIRVAVAAGDFGSIRSGHCTHRRAGHDHTAGLRLGGPGGGCRVSYFHIGVLLVALNVNQFARRSASPGSLYTYITDHMHPTMGRSGRVGFVDRVCRNGFGRQRRSHELCQRDLSGRLPPAGFSIVGLEWSPWSRAIWLIATSKFPLDSCFGCRLYRWP